MSHRKPAIPLGPREAGVDVILVRHGETCWNEKGRYQGWEDPPLSDRGRSTARGLSRWLPGRLPESFVLWSSDLQRSVGTARLALGREPRTDTRLRELHFGAFAGSTYEENLARFGRRFEQWVEHRGHPTPPDGESLESFRDRVHAWLDEVRREAQPAVAVTHSGVIRTLLEPFTKEEHWPGPGEAIALRLAATSQPVVEHWAPPSTGTLQHVPAR